MVILLYFFVPQDVIIEVIYADIIHGKLDQNNQQIEIDFALGRDIRPEAMKEMVGVLQEWYVQTDGVVPATVFLLIPGLENLESP
jgi:hypothetical protein